MSGTGISCSLYARSIILVAPEIKPDRIDSEVGAGLSPYSWKEDNLARGFLGFRASADAPGLDVLLAVGLPTGLVLAELLAELFRLSRVSDADEVRL